MEDETADDGNITIDITGLDTNYTSSMNSWDSLSYSYPSTFSITNGGTGMTTGGGGASSYTYSTAYANATIANTTFNSNGGLVCNGPAEFKDDIKIDGVSVKDTLNAIEKRLSILVPDPKKLAKYEALRKAYDHYKVMEAMCYGDDDE